MWVMTRVVLGNALVREVLLRNHGRAREYTGLTDVKREIEFQERLRSQMEFGNEGGWEELGNEGARVARAFPGATWERV